MTYILIFILSVIPALSVAQNNDLITKDYDWGTKKNIIIKEKGEPIATVYNNISYWQTSQLEVYVDLDHRISYGFYNEKLAKIAVRLVIINIKSNINVEKYIAYNDILNFLTKRYGQPTYIDTSGSKINFPDNIEYKYKCKTEGLRKYSQWLNEKTGIELTLHSNKNVLINYFSRDLYSKYIDEFKQLLSEH